MANGMIYVPVGGNSTTDNGISLYSSGTASGGWLSWNETGFTTYNWNMFFSKPEYSRPVLNWWSQNHGGNNSTVKGNYTNDAAGFMKWISTEDPSNLDAALSFWNTSEEKDMFIDDNYYELRAGACLQI